MSFNEDEKILLKAGDISRVLISIDQYKMLVDLRDIILKYNIRRIGVSSNGKVIGIVTEKDLFNFLYMNSSDRKLLSEIPVKDLLKEPNQLITVDKDASIQFCAKSMLNNNISSLLVTNMEGQIKEILTKTDLVEIFAYHCFGFFSVKECMTNKVITAAFDDNINFIYGLMQSNRISRTVIVKNDFPVGIVTSKDYLPASIFYGIDFASSKFPSSNSDLYRDNKSKLKISDIKSFLMASDIMTPNPLLMDEDDDIAEAARIMIRHRISGLPVINSKMTLTGIVTKTDILKSIVNIY
ncbi:CBS domain-containing protein [Candidatus Nitrosocosmicus hydrocola]|uniref:CBS domain-containing protein n=1 Tax=Candidatus Nitrosocosmicus hydrocola TaxID=1826872 RepID=UPI001372E32E|nr:CBS domain-containing protein [Candidatus Nitrosocosmicus hydrocola]